MDQEDLPTTEADYQVSEQELRILCAAEQKAREDGVCHLRFSSRDDGGVTVTEETEHVQSLEEQANGQ